MIKRFEKIENKKISDYKCINYNSTNLTLFSDPSKPREDEKYLNFELSSECKKFDLVFQLVTQNDLIDHSNKDNPIVPHYQMNNIMAQGLDRLYLTYNFQFIKYTTDNGIIFSNETTLNGVGFYGSNPFDRAEFGNKKLIVDFRMNYANYDYSFKIIVIGNSGVGKSSLSIKAARHTFADNYFATVGVEFYTMNLKLKDKVIKLQI